MVGRSLLVIVCAAVVLDCSQGLRWSGGPEDQSLVYVCVHDSLSLPWTVVSDPGDVIINVQWLYNGRSQEIIATLARDSFLVTAPFSGRVHRTTNAGLEISHVTTLEAGNYTVEIIAQGADGDLINIQRTVSVHVADSLPTTDNQLHLVQLPVAEYETSTDQFHVVLRCGTFPFHNPPPFDVKWTTPSGHTMPSSAYRYGFYYLSLPNPVESGSYTCRLPPAESCVPGNEAGEATVTVDKVDARFAVMEGRQAALEAKNVVLENENTALKEQVGRLENDCRALALRESSQQMTSFHTRMNPDTHHLNSSDPVILSNVYHNDGNAYNPATGVFTARVNGTYFFIASTQPTHPGYVICSLMVDSTEVDHLKLYSDSHNQAGSVQAVVRLAVGQTVWLRNEGDNYYWSEPTAFSGFLIARDF